MVSKIHKDTIYGKKPNGIYTVRANIIAQFVALKISPTTKVEAFTKSFKKEILDKMYLYKTNPNDAICEIVCERAYDIVELLGKFVGLDTKNKEATGEAKTELDNVIHSPLIDNNGNAIRKVKFYQTNLTGFEIRGGIATKEKTFIGFKAVLENNALRYERIDVSNFQQIQKQNDNSFKVYKNDLVFFIYPNGSFRGGKIVSFLEDRKIAAFQNSRFPSAIKMQPESFCIMKKTKDGKLEKGSSKQQSVNSAIGIIKLNLDILGNLKSYQAIGSVKSELLDAIKSSIKG